MNVQKLQKQYIKANKKPRNKFTMNNSFVHTVNEILSRHTDDNNENSVYSEMLDDLVDQYFEDNRVAMKAILSIACLKVVEDATLVDISPTSIVHQAKLQVAKRFQDELNSFNTLAGIIGG